MTCCPSRVLVVPVKTDMIEKSCSKAVHNESTTTSLIQNNFVDLYVLSFDYCKVS